MSLERRGALYLLPTPLGDVAPEAVLPAAAIERLQALQYFIAEDPKSARALLKRVGIVHPLAALRIERLDHRTPAEALPALLEPILAGRDAGLLSEAGMPAVADPGAALVRLAHRHRLRVVPMSGPSAPLLALAASGLEGQRFAFHGYLPVEKNRLAAALRELERQSRRQRRTEIFIETPYRNDRTFATMLEALGEDTLVCVARDLTLAGELIATRRVREWRSEAITIGRRPTVFLLCAS